MDSLESLCASDKKPKELFDRHIVSFLMSKSKNNIEAYMIDITANEPHKQLLGRIRVLATLQKRLGLPNYPNIADWIYQNMDPIINRFHDDERKKYIRQEVKKIKSKGDLLVISRLFDNQHLYAHDLSSFYEAIRNFKDLGLEKEKLIARMGNKNKFGLKTGAQIASLISMMLAGIIIIIIAYVRILKDFI
jgi:hypothetical protein